ncbi:hypothetical protein RB608_12025 [Nocardioides sp. LHD-245]|nr:hypothetical protein [Nocardioides sp. LHD-245]
MKLWLATVVGSGVVGWVLLARYDAWALVLAAVLAALVALGATMAPRRG